MNVRSFSASLEWNGIVIRRERGTRTAGNSGNSSERETRKKGVFRVSDAVSLTVVPGRLVACREQNDPHDSSSYHHSQLQDRIKSFGRQALEPAHLRRARVGPGRIHVYVVPFLAVDVSNLFPPPGQINTVPMKYQVGYLDIVGKFAHFTPRLCYLNVIRGGGGEGSMRCCTIKFRSE